MLIDDVEAKIIEFKVDSTGKVWVNLDGRCVVRIGHVDKFVIDVPDLYITPKTND